MTDPPKATWRLLKTAPASGAWNMAVDEAILEAAGRHIVPPTLRLFAWEPACLSLGYAQPIADVDGGRLAARGWGIVRRPTGGRAILHTDELTYSVIGPEDEPRLAGDILTSYKRLSQALLAAMEILSVPVEAQTNKEGNGHSKEPVCFEVPAKYEITMDGKKIIGSAQARRKEGVLQHGTLPLYGDLTRITQALAFEDEEGRAKAGERLLTKAATVEDALGRKVSWEEAGEAFVQAFTNALNLDLEEGELSEWEKVRAEELVGEKYGNPAWTERV
jgi:lipoate-protein ligase A